MTKKWFVKYGVKEMEYDKEQSGKDSKHEARPAGEPSQGAKTAGDGLRDEAKRARILQCLGNLNALHKVQGALLGQMEREIQ